MESKQYTKESETSSADYQKEVLQYDILWPSEMTQEDRHHYVYNILDLENKERDFSKLKLKIKMYWIESKLYASEQREQMAQAQLNIEKEKSYEREQKIQAQLDIEKEKNFALQQLKEVWYELPFEKQEEIREFWIKKFPQPN